MRRAALALLVLASGCTPQEEAAYQREIDCFTFFYGVPPDSGSPEAVAARAAYRDRAIAQGRVTGRPPGNVEAQARDQHAEFQAMLKGMGARSAGEVQEQKHAVCMAGLRS